MYNYDGLMCTHTSPQDEVDAVEHGTDYDDEHKRTNLHIIPEGLDHPALKDKHDSGMTQ